MIVCPLCQNTRDIDLIQGPDARTYYVCAECHLAFVNPQDHLLPEVEKAFYGTHENGPHNAGYVRFLNQIIEPVKNYWRPGQKALDFGCGPGPTLSQLVRQAGLNCDDYDPFFRPEPLHPPYDIIFATECFEHFHKPGATLETIVSMLAPSGLLAVMTEHWQHKAQFADWYYARDPTHVCFYHTETWRYVAQRFGLKMIWGDGSRRVILQLA